MSAAEKTKFERIITDPAANYKCPEEVLVDGYLSREEKILVLKQWALEQRELGVAEEENMRGDFQPTLLQQILIVLHQLEK